MMAEHIQAELSFTVAQRSVGGNKSDNEDAIGICIPKASILKNKGAVASIADGVSTSEAGKEASETCIGNFISDYYSTPDSWSVSKSASQILTALNRWLYSHGHQFTDSKKGYVSTFSTIIFKSQTAHIFHVGDTRIYRFRNGDLEQLTRDHTTYINQQQSYLARAMGLDVMLDIDGRSTDIELGDIFLLSTDGLHDFVKNSELKDSLRPLANNNAVQADFDVCCQALIDKALSNSSKDNISCQLLRIDNLPKQSIAEVSRQLSQLPFPPYLAAGMILDGYRIEKEIRARNRSQIFIVRDVDSGERYCMKTPSVNFDDDQTYINAFKREAWIGAQINLPNLVKYHAAKPTKQFLYMVTDYIEGQSLREWMGNHPNPDLSEVKAIILQIIAIKFSVFIIKLTVIKGGS